MTSVFEFEMVEGLPSGLRACRLGGRDMTIAAISPRSLLVRTPDALNASGALQLYFYRPETGGYESHTLNTYQTGQAQRKDSAVLTRFFFDDAACAAKIRRMLSDYARFLEIRSSEGASAYAALISGYPEEMDDVFPASIEDARAAWFRQLPVLPALPDGAGLAVELNCPELWMLYLDTSAEGFMQAYARARKMPENWLPARMPDRLYIGNAYCRHLFPADNQLRAIAQKAHGEGIALSLVAAEMRADSEADADRIAAHAREFGAELVINDWGMLERVHGLHSGLCIALGTQLNRRRKDPRMAYKRGLEGREALLARNSLNDAAWISFLRGMGVCRFEYESCGIAPELPDAPCSLHLPFYQTNTSLWCPLKALCERGNRAMQQGADSCPGWCERNALLYPGHLKMLGRWNSLLALDADYAGTALLHGFDRWVLNF